MQNRGGKKSSQNYAEMKGSFLMKQVYTISRQWNKNITTADTLCVYKNEEDVG